MADEALTQAEMEALLTAAEPRSPSAAPPPKLPAESWPESMVDSSRRALTHNHQAPRRDAAASPGRAPLFDAAQLRALVGIHEAFARRLPKSLGQLLRCDVDARLASLGEVSYGEFAASLEDPTCLNLLSADSLPGNLILETSPAVAFPVIDRLLGGGREPLVVARRPLTQIELRLMARVTAVILDELAAAWRPLVAMKFQIERVESNLRPIEIVRPGEPIVLARFEVSLRGNPGGMRLCMSAPLLAAIKDALAQGCRRREGGDPDSPPSTSMQQKGMPHPTVHLVAELAATKLTAAQIAELAVGDIIATDTNGNGPIVLRAGEVGKFRARPGSHQGQRAVQIESIVADDE